MIICVYSINFQIRQIPATNQHFFVCRSRFLKKKTKKNLNFYGLRSFESHLHFFEVSEIMSKYGYLMLPVTFPDKVTPDIDFIDEAVVQCYDVPALKMFL